eukprot:TRINITY_DN3448_c0_g1_i1.p1 TRINITY_DN3448_c0_g1~~TRINITY_DN3448_c0_g1_i1.p1  ORF type:complete len:539 (-),score=298.37 TRINITY_DN3448_c0_g1_i1:75-1691(-)
MSYMSALRTSQVSQSFGSPLARSKTPDQLESESKLHPSLIIEWEELEIIAQVGFGAFAEVSEGLRAGERVAVKKMIAQSLDDKTKKEFEDEVLLMSSLHSSYIVGIYGACFRPPNMCMVLEYLPGGSLNHALYDSGREISWEKRWTYAVDAAIGMNYLHTRNPPVLHRDLKSGNLLIADDGKVKITDFGLSRFKQPGTPVKDDFQGGTDRWTAPEVCDGDPYTEAADVFSYGVILFEIAERVLPFQDTSPEDVRKLWQRGQRPTITDDTPPDFEKLIRMCWDQNPFSRPTFKEVVAYLKRKGKISTMSTERAQGRMSDEKEKLERENDILVQLKENLEKKREEADRFAEKEKQRCTTLEETNEETERRYTEEKNKRLQVERENNDLTRQIRKENERVKQLEDEKKAVEKKLKSHIKKAESEGRDEQQRLVEEAERRVREEERVKMSKIRLQLDEAESKLDEEIRKRTEVEKKLLPLNRDLEDEKKRRINAETDRDALEKKLKIEKRKAETERKKREDLEAEIEEENQRRIAARKAGRV